MTEAAGGFWSQENNQWGLTPVQKAKGKEARTANRLLGQVIRSWILSIAGTSVQRSFDTDKSILALPAPSLGGPVMLLYYAEEVQWSAQQRVCHGVSRACPGIAVVSRTGPGTLFGGQEVKVG
jgi:hypothetical protein